MFVKGDIPDDKSQVSLTQITKIARVFKILSLDNFQFMQTLESKQSKHARGLLSENLLLVKKYLGLDVKFKV